MFYASRAGWVFSKNSTSAVFPSSVLSRMVIFKTLEIRVRKQIVGCCFGTEHQLHFGVFQTQQPKGREVISTSGGSKSEFGWGTEG